jgi:hypothetical protein
MQMNILVSKHLKYDTDFGASANLMNTQNVVLNLFSFINKY